jgi:serine/threonine protein kinase
METFVRAICEATGLKRSSKAQIYMEDGLCINEEDLEYLSDGTMLYFAPEGAPFKSSQIIDQYEELKLLGVGGFGKVYQVKHKKTGELFAMKYIDFTENSK